jgi:hypothetical protein
MPVWWRIAYDCVLLESDATATLKDWIVAVDDAVSNPAFRPGMAVVHDTRKRLRIPESSEIEQRVRFAASIARAAAIPRWALVARPGADHGMARMAQILSTFEQHPRPELRIFSDLAEAVAWARSGAGERPGSA